MKNAESLATVHTQYGSSTKNTRSVFIPKNKRIAK